MAGLRIKKGDLVRVLSGDHKGKEAKVAAVQVAARTVTLEGIGQQERKLKPSQLNPRGGTKKIHRALPIAKVALAHSEAPHKVTRIGFTVTDGVKRRIAKQAKNKEIT